MIYKQPSIYKIGDGGSSTFVQKNILELADDWEDISLDFSLQNANIYVGNWDAGSVADLKILLSKQLQVFYFSEPNTRILSNNELSSNWTSVLKYEGNDFKTALNTGDYSKNPKRTTYDAILGINKGVVLDKCLNYQQITGSFCEIDYPDPGLGARELIHAANSKGFYLNHLLFSVELF